MSCRVDATCFKALLLALVALAACITPATSQIHWNRGWGAGGSMGKRSSSPPSAVSVPLAEAAAAAAAECDLTLSSTSSDCALDLPCLSSLLRIIEGVVSRVAAYETRGRALQGSSSSAMAEEQDQLARFPWWMVARKAPASDQ